MTASLGTASLETAPLEPRAQAAARQSLASDPARSAWVEASAGSGKTKVLTDRVLRLLLAGGQPSRILCLTFTKAAAAEMATRLARELGGWATAAPEALKDSVARLTGEAPDAATLARARALFAEVLELPGGMRISTIHAFCQSLLRSFPLEAGLPPQFGIIEGADAATLLAEARETVLGEAGSGGTASGTASGSEGLVALAGLVPPEDFSAVVAALATDRQRLTDCLHAAGGLGALRAALGRALGLAEDETEASLIAGACAVDAPLVAAARLLAASGNESDRGRGERMAAWLALSGPERAARFEEWCGVFLKEDRSPYADRNLATKAGLKTRQPEVLEVMRREADRLAALEQRRAACRLHAATGALLGLAHPVLEAYEARKAHTGRLDYQDLIDRTRAVLRDPGTAWVLYKLDEGLDHILLDEAQDSNPAQWGIAAALAEEFFAGRGAREERRRLGGRGRPDGVPGAGGEPRPRSLGAAARWMPGDAQAELPLLSPISPPALPLAAIPLAPGDGDADPSPLRSIFAVGDVKQAIYGFQGADPLGFGSWRRHFAQAVRGAGGEFETVELNVSFRSTAPVLALVDAVFADGPARAGVVAEGQVLHHLPDRLGHAGVVELWPPLAAAKPAPPEPWVVPEVAQGVAGAEALLAEAVAARIAAMVARERLPARCAPPGGAGCATGGRPIRPGDILVLVRRRTRFVQLLVRALKQRDVPVGGVDRLALIEQIAVQDVLALCDVLLLPEDDLQLAAALRSPLLGLSDEELFALAHGRAGSLWGALARHRGAATRLGEAADWIATLMARADLVTPHGLLAEILVEPWAGMHPDEAPAARSGSPRLLHGVGRARLLARLGPDAADPLDEVLNAALAYEATHPPGLQGFLHWLRRGGAEVKREPEASADAVRIMTVHGAKGLQAPIVVLPDVGSGRGDRAVRWGTHEGIELPFWAPRNRREFHAPAYKALLAADEASRAEEENRLLYVALTRAEDRLLVCGRGEPEPGSWYGLVAAGFGRLEAAESVPFEPAAFGAPAGCDFGGGLLRRLEGAQSVPPRPDRAAPARAAASLPDWVARPAPAETADASLLPSGPIAVSLADPLLGEAEPPAAAPHGGADPTGQRFRRGRVVHALLQHLPERAPAEREAAARRFLRRPGHGLPAAEQQEILAEVMALLEAPAIAAAFAPGSLAEAPVAGRVGGVPVAGQVDRLAVSAGRVLVLDYKTNRPPPGTVAEVPPVYLRQMALYRAVLRQAFPGRAVECALVWTYGARLMRLPDALLDGYVPEA
ncbi:UvrD-helicase domain-containing protein [Roseomonas sp. NAR14]|uniref:DNA 3'-5' helicase n=1 Tax=Roseomonas acroporae TaxID=2937791 RepID=A0A9X1Y4Y2_9PROT|nr:UvrD-helicase domain-containing protein [Roseomonas acroporae]MCK8784309.1 UvrD-helicase domain-containing protein [Roseomonas acroporae]